MQKHESVIKACYKIIVQGQESLKFLSQAIIACTYVEDNAMEVYTGSPASVNRFNFYSHIFSAANVAPQNGLQIWDPLHMLDHGATEAMRRAYPFSAVSYMKLQELESFQCRGLGVDFSRFVQCWEGMTGVHIDRLITRSRQV